MTATSLSAHHDRLESFTKPSKENTLKVLNVIYEGNIGFDWEWDGLLELFPYELLVFIKNLPIVESSGSIFSNWVRIRDNIKPEVFEEVYDKCSDNITSNILNNLTGGQ